MQDLVHTEVYQIKHLAGSRKSDFLLAWLLVGDVIKDELSGFW